MNPSLRQSPARSAAAALRARAADEYRRPKLPREYRYALVRDLTVACKPLVFLDGIHALAASIHRMRQGRSLQMQERLQRLYGEDEPRLGVLVYTRDADRWAWACLGWAWLDGAGEEALRRALSDLEPDVGPFLGAAS